MSTTTRRDFGRIYQPRRSCYLWVRYRVNGKEHRESTRSTSVRVAERLLARRQAELGLGAFVAPDTRRTTFEDLARIIKDDYAVNGRRSGDRLEDCLNRLQTMFANVRANTITLERLNAYVRDRLEQGAALSTVRNELNALRRAFRLAKRAGRVGQVPEFPVLRVTNVRRGFFEPDDLLAVIAELPGALQPVIEFAAWTGWRIPSEVLPLEWRNVDFAAGIIRLDVGTTKNGEGRVFPFRALPELAALLERQRTITTAAERRLGQVIRWVFHREGRPVREFHKSWRSACKRAATAGTGAVRRVVRPELLTRIPHDLRRTAVRNLVRAGVPERVAMQLTGHKTASVFARYDIVDERDLSEGVAKLATFHQARGTLGAHSGSGGH